MVAMVPSKKVVFVDIDDTICSSPDAPDYSTSTPIQPNIDRINDLYQQGNQIVYWTARGTTTGRQWFEITLNQLNSWGCQFHELRMGKPFYDLLICDKTKRIEEI
jgi:nicotinamidase-related amidase